MRKRNVKGGRQFGLGEMACNAGKISTGISRGIVECKSVIKLYLAALDIV